MPERSYRNESADVEIHRRAVSNSKSTEPRHGYAAEGYVAPKTLGRDSDSAPAPLKKINSEWICDLNERPKTIKLAEETIGKKLPDI